jgi:hypothetical protein
MGSVVGDVAPHALIETDMIKSKEQYDNFIENFKERIKGE